jgi:prevent-host-death family protein
MADWLAHLEKTGRPVILTQRGRAAAVVVRPEMLDELEEERAMVKLVLRGLKDIDTGKLVDDAEVWAEVETAIRRAEGSRPEKMKKKRARPVD